MFLYNKENFKITSKEENGRWMTSVFFNDKLCAEINHNGSLLNPTNKKKIDQAIKDLIPKAEDRASLLLEMTDSFGNWIENPEKTVTSVEALQIMCRDPMGFLLNEVEKLHPGDLVGIPLYILSLMSLNPAVGYYIHVEAVGKSGGGKSHGQKVCKMLLPSGMQHSVDSMSTKSLIYYAKDHSLKNKLVIIDDATEKDIEMLKHVGNNGLEPFTYSSVIDGNYVEFKADASPLLWFSKVRPLEDEGGQVASRFLVFNVDESEEQRKKILDIIEKDVKASISPLCVEIVNECITLGIKDINAGDFEIPDPETIGYRDAQFYKALIKCSALLNYMKRELKNSIIYANEEDIKAVKNLWAELARFNKHKLSKRDVEVYDLIPSTIEGIATSKIRELTGIPKTSLQRILDSLENKELIKRFTANNRAYYYRE